MGRVRRSQSGAGNELLRPRRVPTQRLASARRARSRPASAGVLLVLLGLLVGCSGVASPDLEGGPTAGLHQDGGRDRPRSATSDLTTGEAERDPSGDEVLLDGALYSAADVERWRARVEVGFTTPGEDIARIRSNATEFAADPLAGHWSDSGGSGCLAFDHLHGSGNNVLDGPNGLFEESVQMRDAAWWSLATGDDELARTVADQLVSQATESSVDFTDTSRWCYSEAHERFFPLAMFLAKHLQAMDYVRAQITEDEWEILRQWHVAAGEFHLAAATWGPSGSDRLWADAPNGDYTPVLSWNREHPRTFQGGPVTTTYHLHYNNRRALTAMYAGMVGAVFDDGHLTSEAARWGREFVKFSIFPDGTMSELERGSGEPQLGMVYSFLALGPMLYLADALERASDEDLMFFETREGVLGTESGPGDPPKSLQRAATELGRMMSHEVLRYHDTPHSGDDLPLDLRSGVSGAWSNDVVLAVGNQHWNDPYVRGIYERTNPGMIDHDVTPRRGWAVPWQGAWGLSPGPLLLYGAAE